MVTRAFLKLKAILPPTSYLLHVVDMDYPQSCENPRCEQVTDLRRCTRCQLVSYCSVSCQKQDFIKHKTWCQSAAEAQLCGLCTTAAEALKPAIILHYGDRTLDPDPDNKRFAWATHPSSEGLAAKRMLQVAEAKIGHHIFDIVLMHAGSIYVASKTDIAVPKIRRAFEKSREPCPVCLELQPFGACWNACIQCQSTLCNVCTLSLMKRGMCCPLCRRSYADGGAS